MMTNMSNIYYNGNIMGNTNKKITNPSYRKVVEPMLRKYEGDATKLRRLYPNFDPEAVATSRLPYLLWACRVNHFHAVRGLLQCGASLRRKSDVGRTALYYACCVAPCRSDAKSRVYMVAWLLSEHSDARATINWASNFGWTGLHITAYWGAAAMVRVLLSYGADITLKDTDGKTALDLARIYGGIETIKVLVKAETCLKQQIEIGEWRPQKHSRFSRSYRNTMKTLVVLAKAGTN